jgi:hypothetical protein
VSNWTFGPGKNVTFGRKTSTYLAEKLPPFLAGKIQNFGGKAVRRLTRQQLPSSSPARTCSSWQLPVTNCMYNHLLTTLLQDIYMITFSVKNLKLSFFAFYFEHKRPESLKSSQIFIQNPSTQKLAKTN